MQQFYDWLVDQKSRDDHIGELARHLTEGPHPPCWSNRLCTYRTYLIYRGVGEKLEHALNAAFAEWRLSRRESDQRRSVR